MGIEYYAFALFITGLLCLVAILCKVLFADVRRQRKLLDEKETKLLRLFQTVEEVMEGFNDQVEEAREEIKKHQDSLASREAALKSAALPEKYKQPVRYDVPIAAPLEAYEPAPIRHVPAYEAVEAYRPRPAAEETPIIRMERPQPGRPVRSAEPAGKSGGGITFQRMIDELADESAAGGTTMKNGRNTAILRLSDEGKTVAQIARELGITQNEVKLVIGLNK